MHVMMNLQIYNREYARYPANLSDFKISQRFLAACMRFQQVAGPSLDREGQGPVETWYCSHCQ